ncbi:M16 family metallopeptidase [Phenylobacterium deserti]|uniref:Insulinase family protein n=1 Tax=Phenylobacterium deserti TaxID=1914756 RepID=A0A328ASG8_9CAUL|nr:pitrilysin family protein [Phenylobacterium deserti]RAK58013.1 insulinase family protein [Phenylobacterium deserti]
MRMIRLAAAFGLALGLSAPALAQTFPATPPPIGQPKPFRVPATETFALPNGLSVTLIPYGIAPKTVVSLRVSAGNLNEGERTWLADLTGQMLKEGAAGRSSQALSQAAAGMGGDLNVTVTAQQTIIGMNVLSEHAAEAVRLVSDVARRPDFPESELARVKQNMGRDLAVALSQPGPVASMVFARTYYGPQHPYGRTFPTAEQLGGYQLADIKGFYGENFGARRSRLYVAGQFDAAAVKQAIQASFASWTAGPQRLSLPPSPKAGPQVVLVDRPGAPQSTIRLGFGVPRAGSEGDIPLRVTNALLGGAFSSRITRNIRESKGYTYSPGSGIVFQPDDALWTFQADVTTDVTGPALKEVFHEIRQLQTQPPGAEEAAGMRQYLAGTFILQNGSAATLVNSIATRDLLGLPGDWLDRYVPRVLAVEPATMTRVAGERLPLGKMTLVVVGDLSKITPQLKALPELRDATFQTASAVP